MLRLLLWCCSYAIVTWHQNLQMRLCKAGTPAANCSLSLRAFWRLEWITCLLQWQRCISGIGSDYEYVRRPPCPSVQSGSCQLSKSSVSRAQLLVLWHFFRLFARGRKMTLIQNCRATQSVCQTISAGHANHVRHISPYNAGEYTLDSPPRPLIRIHRTGRIQTPYTKQ